jgi:AraC-like DNA-binding protein
MPGLARPALPLPGMQPARTTPLVVAPTLQSFLRRPLGRYIQLRTSLHFFAPHGALSGAVMWGEPTEADVQRMLAVTVGIARVVGPRVALIDTRAVGHVDPLTFRAIAQYTGEHGAAIAERLTRLAVVHARDVPGAVTAGFARVVGFPMPTEMFTEMPEALRWLDREEDAGLLGEVQALCAKARAVPVAARDLAALLETEPRSTLASAASALAVSRRSLQRLLADQGTTFRRELHAARVRVAQRLLLASSESISRIAIEVGYSSPQQLSGLFRRATGESPTEWRTRRSTH